MQMLERGQVQGKAMGQRQGQGRRGGDDPLHLQDSLVTRRGMCIAMPTTLHELDVMLSNPCSTCSDIHDIDTKYTMELLNPHLGTSPAFVMSEISPREVFSQPSPEHKPLLCTTYVQYTPFT